MKWAKHAGKEYLVEGETWYVLPFYLAHHLDPIEGTTAVRLDPGDAIVRPLGAAFVAGLVLWKWNATALEYRLRGSAFSLSREGLLEISNNSILASQHAIGNAAGMLSDGLMSPIDWLSWMRSELKREWVRQYTLGIGGRDQMAQSDWARVGGYLKSQYSYLQRFYDQILTGDLSPAQIAARAKSYASTSQRAFHKARELVITDAGWTGEMWMLTTGVDNCMDCIDLAAAGWVPIGVHPIPRDGSTVCLFNCYCHKRYRKPHPRGGWDIWDA